MTKWVGVPLLLAAVVSCDERSRVPEYGDAVQLAQVRYEIERTKHLEALANARTLWAARAPSCPAYYYDRGNPITKSAFVEKTTVQIDGETPVWRWYFKATVSVLGIPGHLVGEWIERDAEIGTHAEGFPALTVPQLQDACDSVVRGASYPQVLRVSVDLDGVPRACLQTLENCFNDCERGVELGLFACKRIEPPTGSDGEAD